MQKAPQKNNWWTTALIFMMIYLGFSLFMGGKTGANADPRKADMIMKDVEVQAALVKKTANDQHGSIHDAIAELRAGTDKIPDLFIGHDKLSAAQDLEQMHILNGFISDMSIPTVEGAYEKQIDLVKGLSNEEKDNLKTQAQLLVADTELKAAAQRREMVRLTQANDSITRLARFNDTKPIWNQPLTVAPTKQYPKAEVTPAQLTTEIDNLSTDIGKSTPVWGFFPGYQFVDFLVHLSGAVPGLSYWLAALILAFFVRGLVFPIAQKQMMWSRQMQQLTPLINEIKGEYKGRTDPASQTEMNQKTMALYKEYGMNPLSGCAPALLQMPLFLLIYDSMLNYRFEFQRGTFLWINPHTSAMTHGFLARNLGEKDYVLIVIYGISMVTTAMLAPVSDPSNMKQQRIMGICASGFFGILMFFWPVPSAFVLYWIFTNTMATAQSFRAYRLPLPPLVKKNASNGGVFPTGGNMLGPNNEGSNGKLNGKPKSTGAPKIHKPKKKK